MPFSFGQYLLSVPIHQARQDSSTVLLHLLAIMEGGTPNSLSPMIRTMAPPSQQPEVERPDHAFHSTPAQSNSQPQLLSQGVQLSGQASQGRSRNRMQQRRPKVLEPNFASRISNLRDKYIPSSSSQGSHPDQAKGTTYEAKRTYETWTKEAVEHLLEWLEKPDGYEQYRSAGLRPGSGTTCPSGFTKKHVRMKILEHLASNGVIKDDQQLKNKIEFFEKNYRSALSTLREADEDPSIQAKVLEMCPHYDRLHLFMSKWVSVKPPFNGDGSHTQIMDPIPVFVRDSATREDVEAQDYEDELQSEEEDIATGSHHQNRAETSTEGHRWGKTAAKSFVEVLISLGEQYKEIEEQKMEKREKYHKLQLDLQKKQLEFQKEQQRIQYNLQRQQQEYLFKLQEKQLELEIKRAEAQKLESDVRLKEIALRQQHVELEIAQKRRRLSTSSEQEQEMQGEG